MRITILHGYSARNIGDGFLVVEAVRLLREASGPDLQITVLARDPNSFRDLPGLQAVDFLVSPLPWKPRDLIRAWTVIRASDLIVGVAGGYLRSGTAMEALKTLLVHGPQLAFAATCGVRTVYLPQSVGPLRLGTRASVRFALRRLDVLFVRDECSERELRLANVRRCADLAVLEVASARLDSASAVSRPVDPVPVLSFRDVRRVADGKLLELASAIGVYDVYTQSAVGGNDDRRWENLLKPVRSLARSELMEGGGAVRVVVAVRLHAALLALIQGHYVIHLAYERKGFGAFHDLGLDDYVFPVARASPDDVAASCRQLLSDEGVRAAYDQRIASQTGALLSQRQALISILNRGRGRARP